MKIAVVGSRTFTDYDKFREIMNRFCIYELIPEEYISGGAEGADKLIERYVDDNDHRNLVVIKPDWNKHGKAAGPIRNKEIVDRADLIIAFWDGKSKGTQSTLNLAKKAKKPTYIFYV